MIRRTQKHRTDRRGVVLLVCIFVMLATSCLVVAVLQTQTSEMAAVRNQMNFDQARYLAEAGVSHALALIEADNSWTGTVPVTQLPPSSGFTYTATATANGNQTVIVATGVAGGFTRKISCTVSFD